MNFNPGRAQPSWYGGLFVVSSAYEFYITFDDGDLRAFVEQDVKKNVEVGTLQALQDEACGLVDNEAVDFKAEE
eukprot:1004475-Pleurochrysis_carterae.AAC.1